MKLLVFIGCIVTGGFVAVAAISLLGLILVSELFCEMEEYKAI